MPYSSSFLFSLSLLSLLFCHTNAAPHCIPSERDLLLQFKSFINFTDHEGWVEHSPPFSWGGSKSSFNCCAWHGISCHPLSAHVISLRLPSATLKRKNNVQSSEVLKPLCRLRMLRSLDLNYNFQVNGVAVPEEVSSLSHLLYLDISYVTILGHLPPQLAHISSLRVLKVGTDEFRAAALTPALLSKLKGLEELSLVNMNLNGSAWGKAMCSLHSMKRLDISRSAIGWPFARCIHNLSLLTRLNLDYVSASDFSSLKALANLTNLRYLSMDSLDATRGNPSSLLTALSTLTRLNYLSLGYLDFSGGSFFNALNNLAHLVYLDARYANINESIPSDFHALHPSLSHLDLSSNALHHQIPPSICSARKLTYLSLFHNDLEGMIPPCIRNLSTLRSFFLSRNRLVGSIPSSISKLQRLHEIDLTSNFLNGTFSLSTLDNHNDLAYLALSGNSLSVKWNHTWKPPMSLQVLSLSSCNVDGELPSFISRFSSIQVLEMANNRLVGPLPSWVCALKNIQVLDLSFNHFVGPFPCHLQTMNSLDVLSLSNNNLSGSLPDSFPPSISLIDFSYNQFRGSIQPLPFQTKRFSFTEINLSHNDLTGHVPWTDIFKTTPGKLDLSNNRLKGDIPDMESQTNLFCLNLNSNQFTGSIPSLKGCIQLEVLDLGNNYLQGRIPAWIGEMTTLRVLVLRSNNFDGPIPHQLTTLHFLQVLDLSSNKFSGSLPPDITNFKAMMKGQTDYFDKGYYIGTNVTVESSLNNKGVYYAYKGNMLSLMKCFDISKNHFNGKIPEDLGDLNGLDILNMSYNHFSGKIPGSIGNIRLLDELDLSSNELQGQIPAELTTLSGMGVFNVSNNKLRGPIPQANQFISFPASCFQNNSGLCGLQINVSCSPNKTSAAQNKRETEESESDWEYLVFMGTCGLSFGFGYAAVMIMIAIPAIRKRTFELMDNAIARLCTWLV